MRHVWHEPQMNTDAHRFSAESEAEGSGEAGTNVMLKTRIPFPQNVSSFCSDDRVGMRKRVPEHGRRFVEDSGRPALGTFNDKVNTAAGAGDCVRSVAVGRDLGKIREDGPGLASEVREGAQRGVGSMLFFYVWQPPVLGLGEAGFEGEVSKRGLPLRGGVGGPLNEIRQSVGTDRSYGSFAFHSPGNISRRPIEFDPITEGAPLVARLLSRPSQKEDKCGERGAGDQQPNSRALPPVPPVPHGQSLPLCLSTLNSELSTVCHERAN